MALPRWVFRTKARGKLYYYHQPNRHLAKELRGELTRIPFDPRETSFWTLCDHLNNRSPRIADGTFNSMIALYKESPEWRRLRPITKKHYEHFLAILEKAWGSLAVAELTVKGVVAIRDKRALASESSANQLLRILRTFLKWAVGAGRLERNVARDVPFIKREVETTRPWPEPVWQAFVDHAPEDLKRLAILGKATGQRIGDLVRMRPVDLTGTVISMRIGKRREKQHFIELSAEHATMIESWDVPPMRFYIARTDGRPHTPHTLRAALTAWTAQPQSGAAYKANVAPHGLRALACCDARLHGATHAEIASLFGLSPQMVERYTRHIDQQHAAKNSRHKIEQSRNATAKQSGTALQNKNAKALKKGRLPK